MTAAQLSPWPSGPVAHGPVVLREFSDADLPMVRELATDPYVPLIGTLPPNATKQEAQEYIDRQRGRLAEGIGFFSPLPRQAPAAASEASAFGWPTWTTEGPRPDTPSSRVREDAVPHPPH